MSTSSYDFRRLKTQTDTYSDEVQNDVRIVQIGLRELLVVYCVALALTVGLQWRNHAFASEFTTISDESAHYVTGLLLHDYILHGVPENPMTYATRYYEHYPRIALGHWPPVFYIVQAVWTIPFGVSRTSLILLMAAISAAMLATTYTLCLGFFPRWLSVSLLIFLASTRSFQASSTAVMSDMLVALLVFWSILIFERYIRTPRWQTAVCFAFFAAAAMLTKGTAVALAPIPLSAALLTPGPKTYRRGSFWVAAGLVAVICVPWFVLVPGALQEHVAKFGGIAFQAGRPMATLAYLVRELSFGGVVLAGIGIAIVVGRNVPAAAAFRKSTAAAIDIFWILALLLLVSTLALRTFVAAWEDRHLITLLPFFALFMGAGLHWVINNGFHGSRTAMVTSVVTLMFVSGLEIARGSPKRHLGLDKVAQDLVRDSQFRTPRFLIASDSVGEGVFVAEVAMHENRLGHFVARGSKVLASDGFMGDGYQLKYKTPGELMSLLDSEPRQLVVIDAPDEPPPHVELLRQTVANYQQRWRLVGSYPRFAEPGAAQGQIEVYALRP
jgi:hypothetical protein